MFLKFAEPWHVWILAGLYGQTLHKAVSQCFKPDLQVKLVGLDWLWVVEQCWVVQWLLHAPEAENSTCVS